MVRVADDIADMLSWLSDIEGTNIADILDPLVRPQVTARFERIRPTVEAIKAAKAKHRGTAATAPDLGGEG